MPTFRHGRDTRVLAGQYEISNMLKDYTVSSTVSTGDTTAFTSSTRTYVTGIENGTVQLSGMFSALGGAGDVDAYFSTVLGQATPIEVTVGIEGSFALGSNVAILDALETDYEIKGSVDNMVAVSAKLQGTGGVLTGESLHNLVAETTTANGTGVDTGALPVTTTRGAMGVIHVTAANGSALAVKLQTSPDNVTFTDLITFSSFAAVGSQWIVSSTTATVQRYWRAVWAITGTSFTFQTSLARF